MVIHPIVGVYIPIIRIPIKGGMTIPNIASLDPGSYVVVKVLWLVFPLPSSWTSALMMSKHGYLMIDRKGRFGGCHNCAHRSRVQKLRCSWRSEQETFFFPRMYRIFLQKMSETRCSSRHFPLKGKVKDWIVVILHEVICLFPVWGDLLFQRRLCLVGMLAPTLPPT